MVMAPTMQPDQLKPTGGFALGGNGPGCADKELEDVVILRLNELFDSHAPAYMKALSTDPDLIKFSKTDTGNMYAFHMIQTNPQAPHVGTTMRKDWLDDLGFDIPTTLDEWTTILRAFRDEKGAEAAVMIPTTGIETKDIWYTASFASAFGVAGTFIQENGRVKYGPIQPGFADYVEFMNGWYEEGLIDKDFPSGINQEQYYREGKMGASYETGFWTYAPITNNAREADGIETFELVGIPYPKLNEGDTLHIRCKVWSNLGYPGFITTANHSPEKAVEWFDNFYTDEGYILTNYGIEGVEFEYVDGKPEYTEYGKHREDLPWINIEMKFPISIMRVIISESLI